MSASSPSIGQVLGHYRILERIGAGGMGVVYRGRDERLDRDVALKVLPPGALSDEAARKDFRQEALILSKLNHPNIATIHDFDTQARTDFLVMEYVDGMTLAIKLTQGAFPEKQVLMLGSQIANALEHAHEKGVVHRDLKPGNILVTTKGQVKVLDFGLASLLEPVLSTDETKTLSTRQVPGTLPYMSPEQLQGRQPDFRSDIYSFGAVLYEMATGRRPFTATLTATLMVEIISQPPLPPCRLAPGLSVKLEDVILKCLEKEPENRYQSATELGIDLRRLATPGTASYIVPATVRPKRRKGALLGVLGLALLLLLFILYAGFRGWLDRLPRFTAQRMDIAVLPLANLSGDPDQEYFVEGMQEELISDLAKIKALRVISRTSVMQYKGGNKPLREIAKELGVGAVVEGAVQREGDQVRITMQLIQAPSDKLVWSQNYQRKLHDVLELQSEVARQIAQEIRIAVTPDEEADLARAGPIDAEIHELFLKGRYYSNRFTEEDLSRGISYFEQAIKKDPRYASAYAGLAEAYYILSSQFLAPSEAMPKAESAAFKALELDPKLAEAHMSLALVKAFYRYDFKSAEQEFQRATELNPSSAPAHEWYGYFLVSMGRQAEAQSQLAVDQELDPLSPTGKSVSGMSYLFSRDYDRAVEQLRRASELDPDFWWPRYFLGLAYKQKGLNTEARLELNKAMASAASPWPSAYLGYMDAVSGKRPQAEMTLQKLMAESNNRYVSAYSIAIIHLGLGERVKALDWLEKAYDQRDDALVFLALDPTCDSLRQEPRFRQLVARIGLPIPPR